MKKSLIPIGSEEEKKPEVKKDATALSLEELRILRSEYRRECRIKERAKKLGISVEEAKAHYRAYHSYSDHPITPEEMEEYHKKYSKEWYRKNKAKQLGISVEEYEKRCSENHRLGRIKFCKAQIKKEPVVRIDVLSRAQTPENIKNQSEKMKQVWAKKKEMAAEATEKYYNALKKINELEKSMVGKVEPQIKIAPEFMEKFSQRAKAINVSPMDYLSSMIDIILENQ